MKHVLGLMAGFGLLLVGVGAIAQESIQFAGRPSSEPSQSAPTVSLSSDRTQLYIQHNGSTQTVNAADMNVRVLDALDCNVIDLAPEQTLSGQWFFPNVAVDPNTGNVAVGVMLQECVETQVSAVFVVDPQPPGAYALYRVQVPGSRPLQDEFTTYALNGVGSLGYLDGDLLIKHGDASGSEALLVFPTQPNRPAGTYAGCVYTEMGEGTRLCPPDGALP
ncbi:hypothetical protein ACQ4M4_03215 [Leptolyngbya sp. AN02str]|uniref:hypothetical protein n=1 Tax=Leptolyngbya sp. AN02str TaxID=3423363 RepID=UPI003D317EF4